jgi:hypothetical protein
MGDVVATRQCAAKSLDNSEALGLRFDSVNDGGDEFSEKMENFSNIASRKLLNLPERYLKGEIELALEFYLRPERHKFHLIFSAIPNGISGSRPKAITFDSHCGHRAKPDCWNKKRMIVSTTYDVECPQSSIPSLVWLASSEQRVEATRNVFASAFEVPLKFFLGAGKGEVGIHRFRGARRDCDGVDGMVKGRAEIPENVAHHCGKITRQLFLQANLNDSKAFFVRMRLGEWYVGAVTEKRFKSPVKFGAIFVCPRYLATRTGEMI